MKNLGVFTTKEQHGERDNNELVERGLEWCKRKRAEGWESTPDGLLPITEIQKAGYIKNSEGDWCIPAEEYIYDGEDGYKQVGQKYWAASTKYLAWKKNKDLSYGKNKDLEIERVMRLVTVPKQNHKL